MSKLQKFLNANPVAGAETEVVVSDRFRDEEGNVLKFRIRAITPEEFEEIRRVAINISQSGEISFDTKKFNMALAIRCTVDPNFKDAESIKSLGCQTPEQYINKVLFPGELEELVNQIRKFLGFDKDLKGLIKEAKK